MKFRKQILFLTFFLILNKFSIQIFIQGIIFLQSYLILKTVYIIAQNYDYSWRIFVNRLDLCQIVYY